MKKPRGSKSKKLFGQKEQTSIVSAEPENVLDSDASASAKCHQEQAVETKPPVNQPASSKDSSPQVIADDNTVLIKRTLRSGQCVQFDGNVVVMGDVNPGSEIIASGNIVVMGALRGVVHAGATGNEEATVSAFKLQPTQLRIANHITRAPDGDYPVPEHPETARIKDGVVVIEIYQVGQDRQIKIC